MPDPNFVSFGYDWPRSATTIQFPSIKPYTMSKKSLARTTSLAIAASFALGGALPAAMAQSASAPAAHPAHKAPAKKPPVKVIELAPLPEAGVEQLQAADRVFYGVYDCEFKQVVEINRSGKYPGYVELRHLKVDYLMKPVVSTTGAIRLEDIRGETLMVQIAAKSMLLNVKTAHRLVDDCVSPKQHELMEAAAAAKTAEPGLMAK
jgi:hypothetical protein